jgi:hypothetical protein
MLQIGNGIVGWRATPVTWLDLLLLLAPQP